MATDKAQQWKWDVEDAARVLIEVRKIYRKPKLLKAAKAELKRQAKETQDAIKGVGAALMKHR